VGGLLSLNLRGRSLGRVFLLGPFPPTSFWGLSVTNNFLRCYFACYRFLREPGNGCRVTDPSPAIAEESYFPANTLC
jgi:hypothetical protein